MIGEHQIEEECYYCEMSFTVLADSDDVEFCPFCGEPLERELDEDDEDMPRVDD